MYAPEASLFASPEILLFLVCQEIVKGSCEVEGAVSAGDCNWCLLVYHLVIGQYNQTKMPSVCRRVIIFSGAFVCDLVYLVIESSKPTDLSQLTDEAFLSLN